MAQTILEKKIDIATFQAYVNSFKRIIHPFLKPGVGLQATVYPYNHGSMMKFQFVDGKKQKDDQIQSPLLNLEEALKKANVEIENDEGKTLNPNFKGTNIIMNNNSIYLFKDFTEEEWTEKQAEADIKKVILG